MDWVVTGIILVLVAPFFYLLDWLTSKREKAESEITILKWFVYLDDFNYREAVSKANIFCNRMLDTIYGKGHFTSRCYGISCIISTLLIFILTVGWLAIGSIPSSKSGTIFRGTFIIMTMMMNLQVDYVSLVETRLILRFAEKVKLLTLPILLLVDLLLSAMIFSLASLVFFCFIRVLDLSELPFYWYYKYLLNAITWKNEASILFYSTFSTSLIFYLNFLSALLFKFMGLSKSRIMIMLEKLEDSGHAFKALGGLLVAVVVFVKAVVELIQYIA